MIDYFMLAFYIVIAIQTVYYILFLTPLLAKKQPLHRTNISISVIICAKNEAANLKKFIPEILNQSYSGLFEIIIVNDRSTDNTSEVIDSLTSKHTIIKNISVREGENIWGNKKFALSLGVKAAKYKHLLFTDADCFPNSDQWITQMASGFKHNVSIVLGYGGYKEEKKSFLNKIIRFETLFTAMQYFTYSELGIPYMGVGRNLAYTKELFHNVDGFTQHKNIQSGDDDLFVNQVAEKSNTSINLTRTSFTTSLPKLNFNDWILQKRRHISTAQHYKLRHQFLLALFYISQLLFFGLLFGLFFYDAGISKILTAASLRYIVFFVTLALFSKKLNEKRLFPLLPFLEISLILIQLYLFLKNKLSPQINWN